MKEITIKVPKTIKYITELPLFKDGFPTNKIFIKTLPGWGATHGEVKDIPPSFHLYKPTCASNRRKGKCIGRRSA